MGCHAASSQARVQSGQAAVESAIVLPLFVFLILGTLQLGLMHQARLLTKYAAYKAVRAGSLHNASKGKMEKVALAVLLPMISQPGRKGGNEYIRPVGSAEDFHSKWGELVTNQMQDGLKYAEVIVCGPTKQEVQSSGRELDFDDPAFSTGSNWKDSQRTKLRVQVTFNYRMPIPFADWVIYQVVRGRKVYEGLRMDDVNEGKEREGVNQRKFGGKRTGEGPYEQAAAQSVYIMPIRATYTMRMQSNFYLSREGLPEKNECIFPFKYD
jgi:hypothetical protein